MKKSNKLSRLLMNRSRRSFLQSGSGVVLALPALESLLTKQALAQENPLRFIAAQVPNGMYTEPGEFFPNEGPLQNLPFITSALGKVRQEIILVKGLRNEAVQKDGAGHHARGASTFLSVQRIRKTGGIQASKTVDQMIADHFAQTPSTSSPLHSIAAAIYPPRGSDSSYPEKYKNLSWKSPTVTTTTRFTLQSLFADLFTGVESSGQSDSAQALAKIRQDRSILDFVLQEARSLHQDLPGSDRIRLEEYMESVRSIEQRLARQEEGLTDDQNQNEQCEVPDSPGADGSRWGTELRLQLDLLIKAMECGRLRVFTLALGNEGSDNYRFNNGELSSTFSRATQNYGWHSVSHFSDKSDVEEAKQKYREINHYVLSQFSYLIEQLATRLDYNGQSMLHNTVGTLGAGISIGQRHNSTDLPTVVFGQGGGAYRTGRCLHLQNQSLANLWLTHMQTVGINQMGFADSTGTLALG